MMILSPYTFAESAAWVSRVERLSAAELGRRGLFRRLTRDGARFDAVVLHGAVGLRQAYVDLLAAGWLSHRQRPPLVVIGDCTWETGSATLARTLGRVRVSPDTSSRLLSRAARATIRALDGHDVHFCVLSREEQASFPERWGVDPGRVHFTPFCVTLPRGHLDPGLSDGRSVFAGGDPLRDYDVLVSAARGLDAVVTIASRRFTVDGSPTNVRVGPLEPEDYVRAFRAASVVVVPLKAGTQRSAGQQTYLNAMALGKPVVVTDATGVRDYVEHGRTGVIVPPDAPEAMRDALGWVLSAAHQPEVRAMGERAREAALGSFSIDHYARALLDVVDQGLAARHERRRVA